MLLNKLVVLFVRVSAKAVSRERARVALIEDVEGARSESGNLKMEMYQADGDLDTFYLFERWIDRSALDNHFTQPYTQGAFDLQKQDLSEPIQMNYLEDMLPSRVVLEKQSHRRYTTLIVTFQVRAGSSDRFVKLFMDFVPLVREEPGNIEFHFHRVIGSDTRFLLFERWVGQEDLDRHSRQATTIALVDSIAPLLTKPVTDFVLFAKDVS